MASSKKTCNDRRISCEITSANRAGRAPYNFVPLPDQPWKSVAAPPSHASFGPGLYSGVIEVELKARTNFYIRGMWTLPEFLNAKEEKPVQKQPFQVDGKLRIPGSTLRGLLRTMVEIMSGSPMDYINDTQLFYRTVASVPNPDNIRSFEPQAKAYKKNFVDNNQQLKVQAGYLYGSHDEWYIQPATRDSSGRQYYRYRTDQNWLRRQVQFDVHGDFASIHDRGSEHGWLVCSGSIWGKRKQWVMGSEDPNPKSRVVIPYGGKSGSAADDVKAYKEGGSSKEIRKNGFEFNNQSKGVPCFYVKWNDGQNEHVSFGHTPYFRLPYVNRPPDAIPLINSRKGREEDWDMASAIFGCVGRKKDERTRRGRVIVEDGVLVASPQQPFVATVRAVLGQPKPTTYQHYLVQSSDQLREIIHWDGTYNNLECLPVMRGHKLYWHRPGFKFRPPDEGTQDTVATEFQPAAQGAIFHAQIHYDNLRVEELGALLAAIQLPEGCAHHIGMGKPLGLGSFEVSLRSLTTIDRTTRYLAFLNESGKLNSGVVESPNLVSHALLEFAHWYSEGKLTFEQLWATPRFRELKAMLTLSDKQATSEWHNMTRYLEFGRLKDGNYNEYLQVRSAGESKPRLEKRRPLPAATQVLRGGPNIPKDARPDFEKRRTQQRSSSAAPRRQ